MDEQVLGTIANALYDAKQTQTPIPTLTDTYPDFAVAAAYKVQAANIEREVNEGQCIIGKKVGLTSKGIQEMLGVHEPDFGVLVDNMLFDSETPVSMKKLIAPRVEAEIAFILKKQLKGPGVTLSRVLQATEGVMPAFEIIDSRIKGWKIKLADTVADNGSSAMLVLGSVMTKATAINLRTVGMVLERNGAIIATAASAEVLGHPANSVAWLANKLAEYGQSLEAGEIVLSGALTKAFDIAPNDVFQASFGGLGSVKAVFVP